MIVVFDKKTFDIVGVAGKIWDNGEWREPELSEIYPDRDAGELGSVYVQDSPKYALRPDRWRLAFDENGVPVGVERKPSLPKLHLTTDAEDVDGDGLPEIVADGQSKATITAELKDPRGERVSEEIELFFKTTGGALSARRVRLTEGVATVELASALETITAQVSVSAEDVEGDSLTFEFMPPNP
jgi:hypothetical protein